MATGAIAPGSSAERRAKQGSEALGLGGRGGHDTRRGESATSNKQSAVVAVGRTAEPSRAGGVGSTAPPTTSVDGLGEFVLPVGAKCAQAASLKRPAVTASVPLRWQSRSVALSSLRDHGRASSAGRRRAARAGPTRHRGNKTRWVLFSN